MDAVRRLSKTNMHDASAVAGMAKRPQPLRRLLWPCRSGTASPSRGVARGAKPRTSPTKAWRRPSRVDAERAEAEKLRVELSISSPRLELEACKPAWPSSKGKRLRTRPPLRD